MKTVKTIVLKEINRIIRILIILIIGLFIINCSQDTGLPKPVIPNLRYYYPPAEVNHRIIEVDICVYGGTSGGVTAAVQAARMGKKVALLEFGKHIGGLTSGGLSHTDGGSPEICGGIAREFYNTAGQGDFRPSIAENIFLKMLDEAKVKTYLLCQLDKVGKEGNRIVSITMENGLEVRAKQYIDCTYEGDLMAKSGVSFTTGRESNKTYGETYNGIRTPGKGGHNWPVNIDPYIIPGNPSSGLLPRINNNPGTVGDGDNRIQAYCFRMRLTQKDPLPFPKPFNYNPLQYELLVRLFESGTDPDPRFSIDTNNHHLFKGAYFIDYVGGNYEWPDGDYITREKIFQDHVSYQLGVMWFLTHDKRIPEKWRNEFVKWGLPRDEYRETNGWTHQLYIREGRRMVSGYIMTEQNCLGEKIPEYPIGIGSYNMDSHHCQMTVIDGAVRNEGNVEVKVNPYLIAYRAVTPKKGECLNLLVPIALSASHIAYGSIRMEPVFMVLGQSAGTAAAHAIDESCAVQDIDYQKLRERLIMDKQKLQLPDTQ
ncbi:Probable xanthan lyase [hydrothermal vent metagenome]|uniref:Probable xanthan lyase n=1 Tax=hydrothermal vent metagenome TaxID=652676 RepID=A0A3B0U148_9ZZZZ